jgi:glycyl-tRNA synthetase beta chain
MAFEKGLNDNNLSFQQIDTFATPRRLAVRIHHCLIRQPDYINQRKGPAIKAAFDGDGNPTKAALGFARSCSVKIEDLQQVTQGEGAWLFYEEKIQGRSALELLPDIAHQALDSLPIAKRMRWGNIDDAFIRPVHWILFITEEEIVPFKRFGIEANRTTVGHPYHHPSPIEVSSPSEYLQLLESEGHVQADYQKRKDLIQQALISIAQSLSLHADLDEDLLHEVTSITEWPVAQICHFDEDFLALPAEILVMTMKDHQKYFPFYRSGNQLSNTFVTFANIQADEDKDIVKGNERVVRPRLSDAQFFWNQDLSLDLRDQYEKLKQVIFHKDLGSYFDKTERVKALAHALTDFIPANAGSLNSAAEMSRCDLLSKTVYEFPDLQGTTGKYLAQAQGASAEIVEALDEFYLPRFSGDLLPQSPLGRLLSLSDKTDSLVGILLSGHRPTGDKDPFALRRLAIGIIRILRDLEQPISLSQLLKEAASGFPQLMLDDDIFTFIHQFILSRVKFLALEENYPYGVVDAVLNTKPDDMADTFYRMEALRAYLEGQDAELLVGLFKRISNILNKTTVPDRNFDHQYLKEAAEINLAKALENISPMVHENNKRKKYAESLSLLFQLESNIADFFEHIMVNCDDETLRENRLLILANVRVLFLSVCDFSLLSNSK